MCVGSMFEMAKAISTTAVGTYAATLQYDAAREASKYEIAGLERDLELSRLREKDAIERGARGASAARIQTRALIGSQRAGAAGAGVVAGAGSAGELEDQARYFGGMDALTIMASAEKEAYAERVRTTEIQGELDLARTRRENLRWQRDFQIGSGLLTGGTSFGKSFFQYWNSSEGATAQGV